MQEHSPHWAGAEKKKCLYIVGGWKRQRFPAWSDKTGAMRVATLSDGFVLVSRAGVYQDPAGQFPLEMP